MAENEKVTFIFKSLNFKLLLNYISFVKRYNKIPLCILRIILNNYLNWDIFNQLFHILILMLRINLF
jgi:hypothetical protein